jgi:WD40 repeat protein
MSVRSFFDDTENASYVKVLLNHIIYWIMSQTDLLQASQDGDDAQVRLLLRNGADIHARNDHRQPPLLLAAEGGHTDLARYLISQGADIDAEDKDGCTALLLATVSRHRGVVRMLLNKKADIEASDKKGQRALHHAARLGDVQIVQSLLEHHANVKAIDDDWKTPLMLAKTAGHPRVMQLLDPDKDRDSKNLGDLEVPREDKGAMPTDEDDQNLSPKKSKQAATEQPARRAPPATREGYQMPPPYENHWDSTSIWKRSTGVLVNSIKDPSGSIERVVFSSDGQVLASESKGTISLWNASTKNLITSFQGRYSAFSPDGKLVTSGLDKVISLWSAKTGGLVRLLKGHTRPASRALFSPNGQLVGSEAADNTIRLWETSTGVLVQVFIGVGMAFSPDGRLLAFVEGDRRMLGLWNAETRELMEPWYTDSISSAEFSLGGQILSLTTGPYKALLFNTKTGILVMTIHDYLVLFSSDGRRAASHKYPSGTGPIKIWNTEAGVLVKQLADQKLGVVFSPVAQLMVSISYNTTLLWNTETGDLVRKFEDPSGIPLGTIFSPDGQLLASASSDGTVKLWETSTGDLVETLNQSHASCLSFSPDGKVVVCTSGDMLYLLRRSD